MQRVDAPGLVAGDPAVTALARHPHRLGDVGDGLTLDDDALHEQSSAMECETGVTVSHEDLRFVKTAISTMPGGLLTSADRHQRHGRVHLATSAMPHGWTFSDTAIGRVPAVADAPAR